MAKIEAEAANPENAGEQVEPVKGKSRTIIIAGFVALILLEVIIAAILLPGRSSVANGVDEAYQKRIEDSDTPIEPILNPAEEVQPKPGEMLEYAFESPFRTQIVSSGTPATTIFVDANFALKYLKTDQKRFEKDFEKVKYTVVSKINSILRNSKRVDIMDPNATRLRNTIKQEINLIMGDPPIIKEVMLLSINHSED